MGFLLPKASQSSSQNVAFPQLQQTYSPMTQQGVGASQQLGALLGLGGDQGAANQAFQNFQNSSGFQNILQNAMRGVSGNAAARGLLNSGSTARALQDRASQLGQQSFGNYLQQLQGLSGQGLQAGSLISGAGQQSTSQGSSPGLLSAGLSLLSDRRAKKDIRKISELEDGLGIYEFRYKVGNDQETLRRGVMADEVAKLRPWALGPLSHGFMTVNYGAL